MKGKYNMRKLTEKQNELLEILNDGSVYTVKDLSNKLSISDNSIRNMIGNMRRRFLNDSNEISYIYTSKSGYTMKETPETVAYESKKRFLSGIGILINGRHVFKRCKKIAFRQFTALNFVYKPKMLTIQKLIK